MRRSHRPRDQTRVLRARRVLQSHRMPREPVQRHVRERPIQYVEPYSAITDTTPQVSTRMETRRRVPHAQRVPLLQMEQYHCRDVEEDPLEHV